MRNFPPADQCSPEDLDAIADLVVSDPRASWDLAGSRDHIEALCRRYQTLTQELSNERDMVEDLKVRCASHEASRTRLGELASDLLDDQGALRTERDDAIRTAAAFERALAAATNDLDSAHTEIRALTSTLDAERNERQGEVLAAESDRERADRAEADVEILDATARALAAKLASKSGAEPLSIAEISRAVDGRLARALAREQAICAALGRQNESMAMLLEQQSETRRLDEALRSTTKAITGKSIEQVNLELDAELAAHPDVGPLHHARDMRDADHQEGQ